MRLSCIGTNHRFAPTHFRERVLVAASRLSQQPHDGTDAALDVILLATCNRTELYTITDGDAPRDSLTKMLTRHGIAAEDVDAFCYLLENEDAVRHLARVASGLDSMVVGEAEIAGQVSSALRNSERRGRAGRLLTAAFQAAIRAGRRARAETGVGRGSASVSSVAVHLAEGELGGLSGREVIVVGTGKMGRLASEAFRALGDAKLTIANRTPARARKLADAVGGTVIPLQELEAALRNADLLLTSTSALEPIVTREMVTRGLEARSNPNPLLIIDVAVPRNVDARVAALEGVRLLGIDDLQERIEISLSGRRAEIPMVERIIDEEVAAFVQWRNEVEVEPLIRELRDRAEAIRRREVQRATRGASDDFSESVEAFSRSLVDKLLHSPTKRLKTQDAFRRDEYARIVRILYALEEPSLESAEPPSRPPAPNYGQST